MERQYVAIVKNLFDERGYREAGNASVPCPEPFQALAYPGVVGLESTEIVEATSRPFIEKDVLVGEAKERRPQSGYNRDGIFGTLDGLQHRHQCASFRSLVEL